MYILEMFFFFFFFPQRFGIWPYKSLGYKETPRGITQPYFLSAVEFRYVWFKIAFPRQADKSKFTEVREYEDGMID